MMPEGVQAALDAVLRAESDDLVGRAVATLVQAAVRLNELQFNMLRPVAPLDIVTVLAELRALLREEKPS
jgi:hypothetical protein